jgi:hypothetical protein
MKKRKPDKAPRQRYCIALSFNMVIALVDIAAAHTGPESPRWKIQTARALARRGLISPAALFVEEEAARRRALAKVKLTKKGHAYLSAAQYEYSTAEAFLASLAEAA